MPIATVNLKVLPFRLMKKAEAAHYCSRSLKTFEAQCPVRPVMIGSDKLYDVRDIDTWIDGLKSNSAAVDDILDRLG